MGPKAREAAARFAERRKREDEAPRLNAEIPALASLRMTIEANRPGVVGTEPKHARLVVVERAPSLFLVPCGDPTCDVGSVDMTASVMRALRAHQASAVVERACDGASGNVSCERTVRVTIEATYR